MFGNKAKEQTEKNWTRIWRDFWISVGFIAITNIIGFTLIYSNRIEDKLSPMLWAVACLASGWIIGFLFGIPRVLQDNNASTFETNGAEQRPDSNNVKPYYRMQVNTNLEQISDWLTKIIVGVGLIELRNLPDALSSLSNFLVRGVGTEPNAQALASSIIVYFTIIGFLGGYLMTRIYLAQAFSRADWGTQNTVIVGGQELTLEEASEQQRQQLADVQEQLIKVQTEVQNPTRDEPSDNSIVSGVKPKVQSILWVDDNPKNNSFHVQRLNELGIKVILSLSTTDALTKLESGVFDRIISDISREEGNQFNEIAGIDLLKNVRSRGINTPFLIFSAPRLATKYKQDALELGATIVTSSSTELMKALQLDS